MNPWQGLTTTASIARPYIPPKKGRYRRPALVYDNPWNLTPGQARVISALVEEGSNVEAAERLGISIKTLEGQLGVVVKKMGAANRLTAALEWDRYMRADQTQGATA